MAQRLKADSEEQRVAFHVAEHGSISSVLDDFDVDMQAGPTPIQFQRTLAKLSQ